MKTPPLRLLTFLALLLLGIAGAVTAQGDAGDWSEPLNLSRSGTAAEPQLVAGADGRLHLLWRDSIDGFVYSQMDGSDWSAPAAVELPFATRRNFPDLRAESPTPLFTPQLVAAGDRIHAFWRDSENRLWRSSVAGDAFADYAAWSQRQQLATSAVRAAITTDADGRLHLSYVRTLQTAESPPGIYYRRSDDGGANWTPAHLLYQSTYFRSLTAEEARVTLAAAGDAVYVAWDDPTLERVFASRSTTAGESWEAVTEVDRRREADRGDANGPSGIQVAIDQNGVHLLWQAGHDGQSCNLYHQWSADGGATWQTDASLAETLDGCPEQKRLLNADGRLFLMTTTANGSQLLAWDGARWSEPQNQPPLSGFTDAETFRPVSYNCGQTAVTGGDRLFVASCGEGSGRDIWFLQRSLAPLSDLTAATPVWSTPARVGGSDETTALFLTLIMVADSEGRRHAFWSQAEAPAGAALFSPQGTSIQYARWDGSSWSRPAPVLSSPGGGKAEQPAAAVTGDGRLLAVWSGSGGHIYFSLAPAGRATVAGEWQTARELPAPRGTAVAPDILVDHRGTIYVSYAIALNEERGVYLVSSKDGGETWSEPVTVFDGAQAGWDQVDRPRLALTGENHLHLLLLHRSLPGSANLAELYYSRSDDGGAHWSPPLIVQNGTQSSGPVVWSAVAGLGERFVHRVWQEWDGGRANLWHQHSIDDGLTWNRAARVSGFSTAGGPASLVVDSAERLHLLQVGAVPDGPAELQQWSWVDERWQPGETAVLTGHPGAGRDGLAAAMGADGQLVALYTGLDESSNGSEGLWASGRSLPPPDVLLTPWPTLTPTPVPTATPQPTAGPEPTATPVFPLQAGGRSPIDLGPVGGMNGLVIVALIALVPAGLIVLLVVGNYVRSGRRG